MGGQSVPGESPEEEMWPRPRWSRGSRMPPDFESSTPPRVVAGGKWMGGWGGNTKQTGRVSLHYCPSHPAKQNGILMAVNASEWGGGGGGSEYSTGAGRSDSGSGGRCSFGTHSIQSSRGTWLCWRRPHYRLHPQERGHPLTALWRWNFWCDWAEGTVRQCRPIVGKWKRLGSVSSLQASQADQTHVSCEERHAMLSSSC